MHRVSISLYRDMLKKLETEVVAFRKYYEGLTDEEKLSQHDYILSQQTRLLVKRKEIDMYYDLFSKQVLGLFLLKKIETF